MTFNGAVERIAKPRSESEDWLLIVSFIPYIYIPYILGWFIVYTDQQHIGIFIFLLLNCAMLQTYLILLRYRAYLI